MVRSPRARNDGSSASARIARELTFLVHSPSRDLGISGRAGQRGLLEKVPGLGYRFAPSEGGD